MREDRAGAAPVVERLMYVKNGEEWAGEPPCIVAGANEHQGVWANEYPNGHEWASWGAFRSCVRCGTVEKRTKQPQQ